MTLRKQSNIFKPFLTLWKIFGIWFGRNANKKHKYYTWVNISINLILYTILLIVNIFYTPRKIIKFIPELIFSLTETVVISRVFMVIIMRDKIIEAFSIMDGPDFDEDEETSKKIIERDNANFNILWTSFTTLSHVAYTCLVFVPVLLNFTTEAELKLPICQYYFLSDELRKKYFAYLYTYQSSVIYIHMTYSMTIDTFVAGLLLTGVTQLKVLNNKLKNLKVRDDDKVLSLKDQDKIQNMKLRSIAMRYADILRYCNIVQDIISFNMFVTFSFSSIIICVTLCEILFLPTAVGYFACMVMFLFVVLLQIFMPTYLGTLINYENTELISAAYCSEWVPRSKTFKNNLMFFIERAKSPIKITGLGIFSISISTFTSIVKTAYSFFALIRNVQE